MPAVPADTAPHAMTMKARGTGAPTFTIRYVVGLHARHGRDLGQRAARHSSRRFHTRQMPQQIYLQCEGAHSLAMQ